MRCANCDGIFHKAHRRCDSLGINSYDRSFCTRCMNDPERPENDWPTSGGDTSSEEDG